MSIEEIESLLVKCKLFYAAEKGDVGGIRSNCANSQHSNRILTIARLIAARNNKIEVVDYLGQLGASHFIHFDLISYNLGNNSIPEESEKWRKKFYRWFSENYDSMNRTSLRYILKTYTNHIGLVSIGIVYNLEDLLYWYVTRGRVATWEFNFLLVSKYYYLLDEYLKNCHPLMQLNVLRKGRDFYVKNINHIKTIQNQDELKTLNFLDERIDRLSELECKK